MSRSESNLELIELLRKYVAQNPEIRLHQAMWNLQILTDDSQYNEEPSKTLERLNISQAAIGHRSFVETSDSKTNVCRAYGYLNKLDEFIDRQGIKSAELCKIIDGLEKEIEKLMEINEH